MKAVAKSTHPQLMVPPAPKRPTTMETDSEKEADDPCLDTVEHPSVYSLLKTSLRQRDNLDKYVHGLVKSEIFPYPEAAIDPVPAAYVPYKRVRVRSEMWDEILQLDIEHGVTSGSGGNVISYRLEPEYGAGCFTTDVDPLPKKIPRSRTDIRPCDLQDLRMALWGRYEWIMDKVAYINDLRRMVYYHGLDPDDEDLKKGEDLDLGEEVDPHDYDSEDHVVSTCLSNVLGLLDVLTLQFQVFQ